tara:strand:- start:441 stop:704 length:264 start_codon:yes stop_codon:yes gene_type:complete
MIKTFENLICKNIKVDQINIIDKSDQHAGHKGYTSGMHLEALIISDDFKDKSLIERHRMVYDALSDFMNKEIHALSMKTLTKEEINK